MKRNRPVWASVLIGLWFAAPGWSALQPKMPPRHWELDFEFHDPARISITLPGDAVPTTFWYMLYTVTNRSGHEVMFCPSFDLVTDTLQVVQGGDQIHPRVYDAILARHKKQYPFMVAPLKVSTTLLQGEDNARTSVAIFRDFDPRASRFTVYVGGLSGEVLPLKSPQFDAKQPEFGQNSASFTLRKALGITYDLPGDERTRRAAVPVRVKREWVIR